MLKKIVLGSVFVVIVFMFLMRGYGYAYRGAVNYANQYVIDKCGSDNSDNFLNTLTEQENTVKSILPTINITKINSTEGVGDPNAFTEDFDDGTGQISPSDTDSYNMENDRHEFKDEYVAPVETSSVATENSTGCDIRVEGC